MKKFILLWKPMAFLNVALLLMISLILNSCVSANYTPPPPPLEYKSVPHGRIITEGVEITAEDGSFTLRSEEVWTPPFENITAGYGMNTPSADMVSFYDRALIMGAKKVMVKVPYQTEPLYGVLLLSKIYPQGNSNSAVTRSYQISIPESYVEAAQNGKVSVLYEYYDTGVYDAYGNAVVPKTWVLWLSDIPFSN